MDITEVLEESIGLNSDNTPKAIASIAYQIYNSNANRVDTVQEHSALNPEVIIENCDTLTQIQLRFAHPGDIDMKIFWKIITSYNDALWNVSQDNAGDVHMISVNIIPEKFNGQHFISAATPLFINLKTDDVEKVADAICLIFKSEDVVFCETDDIDQATLESEVAREVEEALRLEELAEKKRREKEAYEERRNRLVEQRRNIR